MRGRFVWSDKGIILPNTLMNEGEELLQNMAFRNQPIGGSGAFYIGLCQDVFTGKGMTLGDIVGEPTETNNYARQIVNRDATDWNAPVTTNDVTNIRSKTVSFSAIGGDYSNAISRLFLTNAATGTTGILFSLSSALQTPKLIVDTEIAQFWYDIFGI